MNDTSGIVDAHDVLIRPARGKRDPQVAPDLILGMTGPILDRLVKHLEARPVPVTGAVPDRVFQAGEGASPGLTLAGPSLGAPQAVLGLENMIALGARRVWATGWCGSLQPDLRIGDLVTPEDAFSDEGTSKHYPTEGVEPKVDAGLQRDLDSILGRRRETARTGRIWSTDAPYRETLDKVCALRDAGLVAVDMEMSALLAVAAFRGVRLAALLAVSDELFDLRWRHGFSSGRLREAERTVAELLEEAVSASQGNDART
ncbi:MAG: nucleoside phosphorylase [Deltaproteobacteria bacterium]|nr:nucleoside phosphorylase [Deltaproteobacteria bacterium]